MTFLPLYYRPDIGWVMDVPRAPKPAQVKWLREWVRESKNIQVTIDQVKGLEPFDRQRVVSDLVAGKIQFNIRGDNMDGRGDIRLFEAPKPRDREYSLPSKGF